MKKIVLICGILASVLSVGMGEISSEMKIMGNNCLGGDKNACQAMIDNGLASVEQCNNEKSINSCTLVSEFYKRAGHYKEAIRYAEKAIALGNNSGYNSLGSVYIELKDYVNAKKYYEIGCNIVGIAESCHNLGVMYDEGQGVRQDYDKARGLWTKACDMDYANSCHNLGYLYFKGLGVKQELFIAMVFYSKACDLGFQNSCVLSQVLKIQLEQ
ncbi:tetratricopeptide repeat protein [Helicobacter sp. T3_23-1056]